MEKQGKSDHLLQTLENLAFLETLSAKRPLFVLLKGIAKGGVKNRNKERCKRLFAFVHICSHFCLRLPAFACVFASAFVSVCLRLFAFARICLRPPLLRPPLRDTD